MRLEKVGLSIVLACGLGQGPLWASAVLASGAQSLGQTARERGDSLADRQNKFRLERETLKDQRRSIFRIISWNVQTFGDIKPEREAAYQMLGEMFNQKRSAKILALQEVANEKGAVKFSDLLPGGAQRWNTGFDNTNDSQDNGFFTQKSVTVDCEEFLFARKDDQGDYQRDAGKSIHPARAAHMRIGEFDFTLVTIHLTFKGGDTSESARELIHILRWLKDYFDNPENDPDVILTGDFNMSTRAGASARNKAALEDIIEKFPTFRRVYAPDGERAPKPTEMISLIDEKTSRHKGEMKNNYDHFIISGDVYDEEYVKDSAGAIPSKFIEAAEKKHEVYVSDHLPISAGFFSSGIGNDGRAIAPDQTSPQTSQRSCWKRGRK